MIPKTKNELLKCIAKETAKVSYPGGMGRGRRQIVKKGCKKALVEYFECKFDLKILKKRMSRKRYDKWHNNEVVNIRDKVLKKGNYLGQNHKKDGFAVAAKFLNTFMLALMKYEPFRHLYDKLHLPIDRKVFENLYRERNVWNTLRRHEALIDLYRNNVYAIKPAHYRTIQEMLLSFKVNINRTKPYRIERIELNCLLWSS